MRPGRTGTPETSSGQDKLALLRDRLPYAKSGRASRFERDPGVDVPDVTADGLSFFVDTTFHPRCGGAVDARAL
jgi:hypothetical protein